MGGGVQQVIAAFRDGYRFLDLPDPDEVLMPGVIWGRHEHALTPAFWVSQAWMGGEVKREDFQLGKTLTEEVVACLLGGHGAPAEVGLAASARVRGEMSRRRADTLSQSVLEDLLLQPLQVRGRAVHYRFARQRAKYLACALIGLQSIDEESLSDIELREALCRLPGIGPKTASWIVRNRRGSDHVAILDIHIIRACRLMGVFPEDADPARHYRNLENRFLEFCARAGTRPSVTDAIMWATMRNISPRLMHFLVDEIKPEAKNRALSQRGGEVCLDPEGRAETGDLPVVAREAAVLAA